MARRRKEAPLAVLRHLASSSVTSWGRGRGGRKRGRVVRFLGSGRPLTSDLMGQGSTRRRKGRR